MSLNSAEQKNQDLLDLLNSKVGSFILEAGLNLGDAEVRVYREKLGEFFKLLKLDSNLKFDFFVSVTAVDWMDNAEERFEIVYHLMSSEHKHRLRVKAWVPEENPEVQSATDLWRGANFMEREVWDMYGIKFTGHPDLRRILMYEEFVGFPLRKDYPLRGKQPRIPLRHPEVRNTAMDMKRPELVKIGARSKG